MPNPVKRFWHIQKFGARFQTGKVIERFKHFLHYRQKSIYTWISFPLNPDWLEQNKLFSLTNIQGKLKINLSKILILIDNNDTGWQFCMDSLFPFLWTGTLFDLFQLSRKIPEHKELQNIIDNSFTILASQICIMCRYVVLAMGFVNV